MSTEQLLKDSVSFNMSINNQKLSSLFRDGNLHFTDEQLKRNFPLIGSFPTESNLIQTVSAPSNGSLFSNLNHINGIRSNLTHFNGLMNQSINLYGPPGVVGCPTMNPYFLESMEHLQHLAAAQKSPINSRVLHVPNHSENFMDINNHPRRKNATRETTSILKAWLNEHKKNPYPTKGEKIMLAVITKMTLTQVSTWFANARRRLKKENKMTWSPNHKSDDEADDLDDTDSSDIPIRLQEDPTILTKSYSKELQNEFLTKLSNINNLNTTTTITTTTTTTTTTTNDLSNSNPTSDLLKSTKPKIWSIADITSENNNNNNNNERNIDKSSSNSIKSSQDNSCPIFSTNIPTQNPALQFLLWKHRDIYQNPLPNLFSKSSRLSFDFNNSKNKILLESSQPKKSE